MTGLDNYNGYTNRETWLVSLWINNEQGSHEYWRERAGSCRVNHPGRAAGYLAAELEREFEEGMGNILPASPGFWDDLLGTALARVDWLEVADVLLEE